MAQEQSTTHTQPHYTRTTVGALVVGLISLPAAFLPFGIALALAALVLGFLGRREAAESGRPLKMANAALMLAGFSIVIWIVIVAGFAAFAWLQEG